MTRALALLAVILTGCSSPEPLKPHPGYHHVIDGKPCPYNVDGPDTTQKFDAERGWNFGVAPLK